MHPNLGHNHADLQQQQHSVLQHSAQLFYSSYSTIRGISYSEFQTLLSATKLYQLTCDGVSFPYNAWQRQQLNTIPSILLVCPDIQSQAPCKVEAALLYFANCSAITQHQISQASSGYHRPHKASINRVKQEHHQSK